MILDMKCGGDLALFHFENALVFYIILSERFEN